MIRGLTLMMLGSGSEQQLPVNHVITSVNNRYTYSHSGPTQSFCFSLSVQYSMNYMRYPTLSYKIDFVLDDFAQLLANISVLSIFKVKAKR